VTADRLLLWRHGRTSYNEQGRFQGLVDVPLDAVGLVQAQAAAQVLAARLAGVRPLRLVSSDLSRASTTAAELSRLLGVAAEADPALREIDAGAWEGLERREIGRRWPADLDAWNRGDDIRVGGGERRSDATRRTFEAIDRHARAMDGGALVVVSHGAVLRGATALLLGLPADAIRAFAVLGNAHWIEAVLASDAGPGGVPARWRLVAYNIAAPGAPADGEPGDTSDAPARALTDPAAARPGRAGADLEAAGVAGVDSPSRENGG